MTEGASSAQPAEEAIRSRLAIALDFDDGVAALRLARRSDPGSAWPRSGWSSTTRPDRRVIEALLDLGFEVFCDLKLYDIPTTVRKASHVVGSLGARYLNAPAAAGAAALEAMVEGFDTGAATTGTTDVVPLAVTVLTSEPVAPADVLRQRVELAMSSGCRGVVCATPDIAMVREIGPDLLCVVPGIRPAGAPTHDQGRVATPSDAIAAGADLLVIGRAVTEAEDSLRRSGLDRRRPGDIADNTAKKSARNRVMRGTVDRRRSAAASDLDRARRRSTRGATFVLRGTGTRVRRLVAAPWSIRPGRRRQARVEPSGRHGRCRVFRRLARQETCWSWRAGPGGGPSALRSPPTV